jgi:pyruvate/2-oxoglutarate dehydrogenase complex dihydrolipoamide dehydrogenase (E3) component
VWAIGECAGSPQFTHVSEDDFRIIRDNLAGGKRSTRDRLVPYCVFTDPPLAHVGLSEGEAQRQGVAASIGKLPTSAVLRAQAIGEKQGFMKVLVDANDDRILGFTMIGSEAGEVMAVVQTAMLAGLPYTRLRDVVLTHPTMAEGLVSSSPTSSSQRATGYAANLGGVMNTAAMLRSLGRYRALWTLTNSPAPGETGAPLSWAFFQQRGG